MKAQIGISSMRAALNSAYCMRAVLEARKNQVSGGISDPQAFHYKEGQHAINGNGNGKNGHDKVVLPPEVKITPTSQGKRWSTSAMEVELRGDVLEIRDGFGNIIGSVVLNKISPKENRAPSETRGKLWRKIQNEVEGKECRNGGLR